MRFTKFLTWIGSGKKIPEWLKSRNSRNLKPWNPQFKQDMSLGSPVRAACKHFDAGLVLNSYLFHRNSCILQLTVNLLFKDCYLHLLLAEYIVKWLKTWAMVKGLDSPGDQMCHGAGGRSRQGSLAHLSLGVCLSTILSCSLLLLSQKLGMKVVLSCYQLMFVMLFEDEKDYINAKCKFLFSVSISDI